MKETQSDIGGAPVSGDANIAQQAKRARAPPLG